jgi:hypothetical protein
VEDDECAARAVARSGTGTIPGMVVGVVGTVSDEAVEATVLFEWFAADDSV